MRSVVITLLLLVSSIHSVSTSSLDLDLNEGIFNEVSTLQTEQNINLENQGSSDTSVTDLLTDDFYQFIMDYVYYGEWYNTNPNAGQAFGFFENNQGFLIFQGTDSDTSEFEQHFGVAYQIFDGPYVDQNYVILETENKYPVLTNRSNATMTVPALMYYESGYDESDNTNQPCNCTLTFYFINMNSNQPFKSLDAKKNYLNYLAIQTEVTSIDCQFSVISDPMWANGTIDEQQLMIYVFGMVGCACLQYYACYVLIKKYQDNEALAKRVSLGTLWIFNTFDLNLSLLNMGYSVILSGWICLVAILYFILAIFCEAKLISQVVNAFRRGDPATLNRLNFYLCFWMITLALTVFITIYYTSTTWLFFLYAIHPLPQIIDNYSSERRYKVNYWVLGALGLPKLAYMLYVKLYPDNLFRRSPDPPLAYICLIIIALQWILLLIQKKWPTFFMPRKQFDYYIHSPESLKGEMCPICMDNLLTTKSDDGATAASVELLGSVDEGIMKTPCQHMYHESCLKEWMRKKLECPNCRKPLPALDDDDEDENENEEN